MTVPAVSASMAFAVYVAIWRVWKVSSATLMVSASEEFLSRFSDSLVPGGMMRRSATGRITYRYAWNVVRPEAVEASNWVRGMDWMPERSTSEKRAPL